MWFLLVLASMYGAVKIGTIVYHVTHSGALGLITGAILLVVLPSISAGVYNARRGYSKCPGCDGSGYNATPGFAGDFCRICGGVGRTFDR